MAKLDFIKFINQNTPNLSSAKKQDVVNDLCEFFSYREEIQNEKGEFIPNPQSKTEFANEMIQNQVESFVNEIRKQRAEKELSFERLKLE